MNCERESETLWSALRYVCGELAADEAAAFEQRLEHDQAAREAVAQAVELAGAVARLDPESQRGMIARRSWTLSRPARWVAAAAAVLLAALALSQWPGHHQRNNHPTPGDSRSVALAWSGVHKDQVESDELFEWLDRPSSSADATQESSDGAEVDVPDWMVAAVALGERVPGDEPNVKEN